MKRKRTKETVEKWRQSMAKKKNNAGSEPIKKMAAEDSQTFWVTTGMEPGRYVLQSTTVMAWVRQDD